jgi:hypothetical protein
MAERDREMKGRVFDDLELRHLLEVIHRCSLILHDLYAENEIREMIAGRFPEIATAPPPPGPGALVEVESQLLRSLRDTPDHVRNVADKCLYDVGLVGLDVYRGVDLSELGVQSYRLASESLGQLADDRQLRHYFRDNGWANLPLQEEILFLQQCSDNFLSYAEILRHLRDSFESPGAAPPVRVSPVTTGPAAASVDVAAAATGPDDGAEDVREVEADQAAAGDRDRRLGELERTLLFAGIDLDAVRERLRTVVVDQDEAVETLCDDLALRAAGTGNRLRPSSFLFIGPTGVGKNYLIESLVQILERAWEVTVPALLLEGPQFTYPSDINDLKGATRGFIRSDEEGMLSEFHDQARSAPMAVLVVDEVEKAHPQLTRFFLSILDRGTTTDNRGRLLDFSNTLIVFTSNIGFSRLGGDGRPIGYQGASIRRAKMAAVHKEVRRVLSPEFLNRLKMIEFQGLSRESMQRIFDLELEKIRDRFRSAQGLEIEVEPEARTALIDRGFSNRYGARHLTAVMETHLTVPITRRLLRDRNRRPVPASFLSYFREIRQGRRAVSMRELESQVRSMSLGDLAYDRIRVGFSDGGFRIEPDLVPRPERNN